MKLFLVVSLALLVVPSVSPQAKDVYLRSAKAQKYAAEGFTPVDCFAGNGS
jgi:hypothetical protein